MQSHKTNRTGIYLNDMNSYLEKILKIMPPEVKTFCRTDDAIYEIRVRPGKKTYVITAKGNFPCGPVMTEEAFGRIFSVLNGGSLYKHEYTLPFGYFTDVFGGRCGAVCDISGEPLAQAVIRVRGLNIRIPRFVRGLSEDMCRQLYGAGGVAGTLIYAAPCTGKTTVIRDIARVLSEFPNRLRVCVVDERREFDSADYRPDANIDILSGYHKQQGIEIAVRTLSAQVIICDEIGDFDDAKGICQLANSGVPLIATAHAQSLDELFHKDAIRLMRDKGIFKTYIHLTGFESGVASFEQIESN